MRLSVSALGLRNTSHTALPYRTAHQLQSPIPTLNPCTGWKWISSRGQSSTSPSPCLLQGTRCLTSLPSFSSHSHTQWPWLTARIAKGIVETALPYQFLSAAVSTCRLVSSSAGSAHCYHRGCAGVHEHGEQTSLPAGAALQCTAEGDVSEECRQLVQQWCCGA